MKRVLLPGVAVLLLALSGCSIEQIAGTRDVIAGKPDNIELPMVFEGIWQRTWRHSDLRSPYDAVGALKVSNDGVEFIHPIGSFFISAESIRNVTYISNTHEVARDWVILEYRQGPMTKTVEFKAPPDAAKDTDDRIYWALFEAREAWLRGSEAR